jgi:hypothetical protein
MSRDTIGAAKTELLGLLSGANLPAGVTKAYGYEPTPGQLAKPTAITISTAGWDLEFWQVALRVYQSIEVDAEDAQENLDAVMSAVEGKLTSGFGMAAWTVDYLFDLNALVATCIIPVGRED